MKSRWLYISEMFLELVLLFSLTVVVSTETELVRIRPSVSIVEDHILLKNMCELFYPHFSFIIMLAKDFFK